MFDSLAIHPSALTSSSKMAK